MFANIHIKFAFKLHFKEQCDYTSFSDKQTLPICVSEEAQTTALPSWGGLEENTPRTEGAVSPAAHPGSAVGSPPAGLQGDILTNGLNLLNMEVQRFPGGQICI